MDWTLSSIYWMFDSIDKTIASYGAFIALFTLIAGLVLSRVRQKLWAYLIVWTAYLLAFLWLAFFMARDLFDAMNLAAMGIFVGGVAILAESAYFAWPHYKKFGSVLGISAIALLVVGVDAFLVEPYWFDVRHETLKSAKIDKPVRIVVIADFQTDRVGPYEKSVLERTMNEHPDLILLPGDYIEAFPDQQAEQVENFRRLMKETHLSAPLGVYATEGDQEHPDWNDIFKGLPVHVFATSGTVYDGNLVITGLNLKDSYRPKCQIPHTEKFHIIVGHRPDFARFTKEGDLYVAGHTHGGQVKLPFFGPLLTFSEMPRQWCGGCNVELSNGASLIISRGIGMERGLAPRLRFLCRPEIVVVDVLPVSMKH